MHRLLGLPPGPQLDRLTALIFRFYERMRDDPGARTEAIRGEEDGITCYPVLLKFAVRLREPRRDGRGRRPSSGPPARPEDGEGPRSDPRPPGAGGMGEVYAASRSGPRVRRAWWR